MVFDAKEMLDMTQNYADRCSTCAKVKVGSCIVTENRVVFGCNWGVCDCKNTGCRRKALYGNASKEHRLPSDCDSVHSEVDAIASAAKQGIKLDGATIYVTRYPCEACARAIKSAGISRVIYGRQEEVSDYTKKILEGIKIVHFNGWDREDNHE